MENREIKIGKVVIKDFGKIRITSSVSSEEAFVRYMDEYHFEMSNTKGEFNASGSNVWGNLEYEDFCHKYGITVEAI